MKVVKKKYRESVRVVPVGSLGKVSTENRGKVYRRLVDSGRVIRSRASWLFTAYSYVPLIKARAND